MYPMVFSPEHSQAQHRHPHSAPRPFAVHDTMGFSTPPPRFSHPKKLPFDLDSARKKLDFTIQDVRCMIEEHREPSILHSDCPPDAIARTYKEQLLSGFSMYLADYVSQYFFALNWSGAVERDDAGRQVAVWEVVVLVDELSLTDALAAVNSY